MTDLIGLRFAYLKGSLQFANEARLDRSPLAREQLVEALAGFRGSVQASSRLDFMARYYEKLSKTLVDDANWLLAKWPGV